MLLLLSLLSLSLSHCPLIVDRLIGLVATFVTVNHKLDANQSKSQKIVSDLNGHAHESVCNCLLFVDHFSLFVVRCPTAVIHHRTKSKSKELPAGASESQSQSQSQLGSTNGYSNTFQASNSNWNLPMETFSSKIL